jgi:hypothetical protein
MSSKSKFRVFIYPYLFGTIGRSSAYGVILSEGGTIDVFLEVEAPEADIFFEKTDDTRDAAYYCGLISC